MLFCSHFKKTSVVAVENNNICAFVSAYRPPIQKDALFVWQVAVDSSMRGKGIAPQIIINILDREYNKDIKFIQATVTPSNKPSERLFKKLSEIYNTKYEKSIFFKNEYFGSDEKHEDEYLFDIGPIR